MNRPERRRNRNYDTAVYHHDNHHHRKDTRAAHAASAYGGESAGAGFPFQGRAAAFVPLQGEIWETGGMNESQPWTTCSTAGRGGWFVSAATMTTASVCCLTRGTGASVSRAFPIPCAAAGSVRQCCL